MRKLLPVLVLTTIVLAPLAAAAGHPPARGPRHYLESFESGLRHWSIGTDLPEDPNNPGHPVAATATITRDRASHGASSLRFWVDGHQDDGTIWIVRPVGVEPGRAYRVSLSVDAYSFSESFNTIAHLVLYAGPTPPRGEGSFDPSSEKGGATHGGLREPLNQVHGWKPYALSWESGPVEGGRLFVAVGVTIVWETQPSFEVDRVRVILEPL